MKHNLKFAWATVFITLLGVGCKKESGVLLKQKSTVTNLINGNTGSQPKSTKSFSWEPPEAEGVRQSLKERKQPYAVLLPGSAYRELGFKNGSKRPTGQTFYINAKNLGINEDWTSKAEAKFINALEKHMQNPASILIGCMDAKRKHSHMVNIYNPNTKFNVELNKITSGRTEFHKVTKLNPNQANELAISGRWPSISQ